MIVVVFDSRMVVLMFGRFGYGRRKSYCYMFLECFDNGKMMCLGHIYFGCLTIVILLAMV